MFHPDDAAAILRLPAPAPGRLEDLLLWNKSKTDLLTVKAVANHLLYQPDQRTNSTPSTEQWRRWWKVPIEPRLLLLGWRLFKNSLPTRDNLAKKHINPVPPCPLCGQNESSIHTMLHCPLSRSLLLHFFGLKTDSLHPPSPAHLLPWLVEPPPNWPPFSADQIRLLFLCWDTTWHIKNKTLAECSPTGPIFSIV